MIPQGTKPEELVKNMDLCHVKAAYKFNTQTVHWSGGSHDEINYDMIQEMMKDPCTLAIWENDDLRVVAWVEKNPESIEA
jgi:hypothetical protein